MSLDNLVCYQIYCLNKVMLIPLYSVSRILFLALNKIKR